MKEKILKISMTIFSLTVLFSQKNFAAETQKIKAEIIYEYKNYELTEDYAFLILPDLYLQKNQYKVLDAKIENESVITNWIPLNADVTLPEIKTVTDKNADFISVDFFYAEEKLNFSLTYANYRFTDNLKFAEKIIYKSQENKAEEIFIKNIKLENMPEKKLNDKIHKNENDKKINLEEKNYDTTELAVLTKQGYRFYKKFITNQDIPGCIYTPTCSQYAQEAIAKYGFAGIIMGLERLNRCNKLERNRNFYPKDSNGKFIDNVK